MESNDLKNKKGEPLRYLVFSASLRADSLNTKLAAQAAKAIVKNGGVADVASMADFDCPSYNQDIENKGAIPNGALEFRKRLLANDAFVISSPEYNGSIPGLLKNVIDWASRFKPQPFYEKNAFLISASPSMVGGNRGLWTLRVPLEHLGARVYPDMFSLAMAHKSFTPEGAIADVALSKRFEDTIAVFMSLAEASKNYPCIKKAWIEFLGERLDPAMNNVN